MLSKDQKELLSVLNAHGADYLVVGGYAVGVYSEPRATKDLDVFIRADARNSEIVFRALAEFGAPLSGMTPADFNDGKSWFQMGRPPDRIDVLQHIDSVDFADAWERREDALIEGTIEAHVISRDDLIRNKLACGRPRDLLDVEDIRQAERDTHDL